MQTPPQSPMKGIGSPMAGTPLHAINGRLTPLSQVTTSLCNLQLGEGDNGMQVISVPVKEASCFMLPVINAQYLARHTFKEWKKLWEFQVAENAELHLTGPQLKNVVGHIQTPWRNEIIKFAMSHTLDDVLEAVEKRCAVYRPSTKTKSSESFEAYLQRLKTFTEDGGLSYADTALCEIIYQYVPLHIRSMVKNYMDKKDPATLAVAIDNEITRDKGFPGLAPEYLQPYMMNISQVDTRMKRI